MNIDTLSGALKAKFPDEVVDRLLASYQESKRNFYLRKLRPSEVEGGRFSEAAFRMLEHYAFGTFTPLGDKNFKSDALIQRLAQIGPSTAPDSVRLNIPRALRVIYDIRNQRDAAHLADGIDANLQDATLVVSTMDWILSEFVRLSVGLSPDQSFDIIQRLVRRSAGVVEELQGTFRTIKSDLTPSERVLVLLYHFDSSGATVEQIVPSLKPNQRANIRRTLETLEHDRNYIRRHEGRYYITGAGIIEVESKRLFE